MRVLITGGCGFIGHHVVEHIIKNTDWQIVVWDKLTYASAGFNRLRDINCFDDKRITILTMDFNQAISPGVIAETRAVDYLLHLGAETHVDKSIENPEPFVMANVLGTMRVLDYALKAKPQRFIYFSTDEIFGPAPKGVYYKEDDRWNPTNPYSATKAGGEALAMAYANSYNMPVMIAHTMNAFGERQHPEKFIPSTIRKILNGEKVFIHADPTKTISGSRFYIHCRNIASALLFLLSRGKIKEKYNIVGEKERSNLEVAKFIAKILGQPLDYEMVDFHSSRPGHDLRYALSGQKMKKLGWKIPLKFEQSFSKMVNWYLNDKRWLCWAEE